MIVVVAMLLQLFSPALYRDGGRREGLKYELIDNKLQY